MIKTERRTSLGEEQLDILLHIAVDSPPFGILLELLNSGGKLNSVEQCRIQELHHVGLKKRLMVHLIHTI